MRSVPTDQQTTHHRLADLLLGDEGPLETFVRSRRPKRAWRLIARDLYEVTEKQVDLTYETLRSWFPDRDPCAHPRCTNKSKGLVTWHNADDCPNAEPETAA